ncbi:MAG TPA: Tm-1-like ATP-binding domain-containing protein, partial [Hydrogenophaga sp.]
TCLLLPLGGVEQWDRPGEPLHDPEGLKAFADEMVHVVAPGTVFQPVDAHINDEAFAQAALQVFDRWVAAGLVPPGVQDKAERRKVA